MYTLQAMVSDADLDVFDFDGTIFDTATPSPHGRSVKTGYEYALSHIFGEPNLLEAIGGFKNQAPGEIVEAVFALHPSRSAHAANYYKRNSHWLVEKAESADLRLSYAHDHLDVLATELLVILKLEWLTEDVRMYAKGMWPIPMNGAANYLRRSRRPYAILSSGHTRFIRECLALAEFPEPLAMLTDDDMRRLKVPLEERTKPSEFLMECLETKLALQDHVLTRARTNYFGDDVAKDGMLAHNAEVRFACYNPLERSLPKGTNQYQHYNQLTALL